MEQLIEISHVNGGWRVEARGIVEPIHFLSGGQAEATALQLGRCLSALGRDARVRVRDRFGVLVGDHRIFAAHRGLIQDQVGVSKPY